MQNYLSDKNKPAIEWIDMGDIGHIDERGNLVVSGRSKDVLVLKNSSKINTSTIERLLQKCDEVIEVLVLKKPNLHGYDLPCAHIYTENAISVGNFIDETIPKIYEVQPFFYDNPLPKLSSGKFDAVKLNDNS